MEQESHKLSNNAFSIYLKQSKNNFFLKLEIPMQPLKNKSKGRVKDFSM